jgi:hypothetical protein
MECKTTFRYVENSDEFIDTLIKNNYNFYYSFIRFEPGDTSKTILEIYFKNEIDLIIFNLTYEHDNSK